MNLDLIKLSEIYLIPNSFLVAALGTADTNPHKASVSLLAFIVSVFWLVSSREALTEIPSPKPARLTTLPRRIQALLLLPYVFIIGWSMSAVIHTWLSLR